MTRHSSLVTHALDMVEHEPRVLQVSSWLHPSDKVNTGGWSDLTHLEDKDFVIVSTLPREHISLDEEPGRTSSHLPDAIHGISAPDVLEV